MKEEKTTPPKLERRYDLDWLRIIAIFLVFIYHSTRLFDGQDWHIKNNVVDRYMIGYFSFLTGIGMPLFFMIAGMGAFFALKFVSGKKYILARFVRLMIPFLFGIFTHISIQVYIERISADILDPLLFDGNFFEFYFFQYYKGLYGFGGNFAWIGLHLWFLVLLFLFSLLTLPIFNFISKEKRGGKLKKLGSFFHKPGALLLLIILPIIIEIFNPLGGEGGLPRFGGWNLFSLLVFTIYGYLLVSNDEFDKSIEKHKKLNLFVGIISAALLTIVLSYFSDEIFYDYEFSIGDFLFWVIRGIYGWCWIILLFSLGRKYLNVNNKSRKFLNEIVMPFYVLHQTIIVLIGFFIVKIDTIIIVKYLIISFSSLLVILGLVLIIRKVNVLRFLFGMSLKRKKNIIETLRKE